MVRTLLTGLRSPGRPGPVALETEGGRVTWTGAAAEARSRAHRATRVEELDGVLLTSPFVDAHVHATASGLLLDGLDLTRCATAAEVLAAVAAAAGAAPPAAVVWGHGWEEDRWSGPPPSRAELDRAAGGRAVYLSRIDVHSALVSTALVDRAPGAVGATGWSPTGPLSADAHHHVRRAALAALDPAQRRSAQAAFLDHAAARGVAEVHECAGPEISGRADLADLLGSTHGVQVVGYWGEAVDSPEAARALRADTGAHGLAGDLFVDGSLGSRTAALHTPYLDAPGCTGNHYLDAGTLAAHLTACTRAGIQAGFHVIGEAAVEAAVAALEEAARRTSPAEVRAARHRLEHLEMVDGGQAARLAALGVVASVQPLFDAAWGGPGGMYAARLGAERARGMNPFRALDEAGVVLAFGSDSPVTPLDPWAAVRAATAHRTPASSVGEATALAAHTAGGRYAAGGGGSPIPVTGGPASYALWDGTRCLRTVREGRILHGGGPEE
ncbi:amidohydrolase family protein [Pseudonocardia sp. RS11V-5]|uniref:amidohydrolase n=1 Tax=Pseudonocardia terrae TaxID=2905831 RepID=UPI001E3AEC6D|nr:amidohydrolase family protein [Pseudonocardia terrae]MCE3552034.1 amidohydrolase family protein [Pseudonocardia terrae]